MKKVYFSNDEHNNNPLPVVRVESDGTPITAGSPTMKYSDAQAMALNVSDLPGNFRGKLLAEYDEWAHYGV